MKNASTDLQQPTFRVESDGIGEVRVPSTVLCGPTYAAKESPVGITTTFRQPTTAPNLVGCKVSIRS
jgi:hypothetical protein